MPRAFLCVTIDCECDKGPAWRSQRPLRFAGIAEGVVRRLQPLFRAYKAKPTYLLSPEVLHDEPSVASLRTLAADAELGTHLHGEYAEPGAFDVEVTKDFQRDYPRDIEQRKLAHLTDLFARAFGKRPRSFRAGRFGIGPNSIGILDDLGYDVESSVTPHVDWSSAGAKGLSFVGAPTQPYHPDPRAPTQRGSSRLLEVPVTIRPPRFGSLLSRALQPRWLRPSRGSANQLVGVAKAEIADAQASRQSPVVLNAMLHNVEVIAGASPYAATEDAARGILDRLGALLAFAAREDIQVVGLGSVPELFPVKVVHVVVAGDIGGAERMLADLATRPHATGVEHAVATMSPNPRLVRMLRDAGLRVHDRGSVHEGFAPYLWRSLGPTDVAWLTRVLEQERARVVHLHTFGSQVIGTRAATARGVRIVRTEHSTRVYADRSCWPFSRWSLQRADAIVAISAHVHAVALGKAPWARPRLRVVHDGVDVGRFAPRVRSASAPPDSPFRFVAVGRLEPRKGLDLAIEALAAVPGTTLDVVGDGPSRARLERLARTLCLGARVVFHGYRDDPRDVLASADAMVCSSREEGLGIALLEAMAMELPVVTFAVGGVPESVKDEETGWITRENTATALAARMRDAARDREKAQGFGRAARDRVAARFSVERMCAGYGEIYASLV